jgi:hypothetical protein
VSEVNIWIKKRRRNRRTLNEQFHSLFFVKYYYEEHLKKVEVRMELKAAP